MMQVTTMSVGVSSSQRASRSAIQRATAVLATLLVLAAPAGARAGTGEPGALIESAFGGSFEGQVTALEPSALESTRARFGPAAFIFGVAGVDLALSAFFWGVYVPTYLNGGLCGTCTVPMYIAR